MQSRDVASQARRLARQGRTRVRVQRARWAGRGGRPLPAARQLEIAGDPLHLVPAPVFLLSSIRSGSTLLRVVLNSHSQICAPHELHLRRVRVELPHPNAVAGMKEIGLDERGLENLVWDRVLHLELVRAGKSIIVDKTPQNVFVWRRLVAAWPQARYVILLRHPVRVYESIRRAWPEEDDERHLHLTIRYAEELRMAADKLPNLSLRYEDFVADPQQGTRDLCAYLGVPWEPGMVRYAEKEHGRFRGRLGDFGETIRSGVIRPPAPPPEHIPAELHEACRLLGYV